MNWSTVFPIFSFILLAALPGRTTFVILLLAARSRAFPVFIGSVLAFLIQSLISVLLGSLLGTLPQYWVKLGSGLLFLFFSFRMWREGDVIGTKDPHVTTSDTTNFSGILRNAFFSVFAAEWGDVSQLAIASVAAQYTDHLTVWGCAAFALTLTATLAVGIGSHAHKVVHPKLIHYISIFVFGGVGFYFLIEASLNWGRS